MLTLEKVYSYINEDQKRDLIKFIEEKTVTEKQLKQIFNSFDLDENSSSIDFKIKVYALIVALHTLQSILNTSFDAKQKDRTIKRLMSKDIAIEALNELLVHFGLTQFFENYYVNPLFLEGPDGRLKDQNEDIPIEIKSRFPKKILFLKDFLQYALSLLPTYGDLIVFANVKVTRIGKIDNINLCDLFKDVMKHFDGLFTENPIENSVTEKEFLSENISFRISTLVKKSSVQNTIGLSKDNFDKYLVEVIEGQLVENGIVPQLYFTSSLNKEVNLLLTQEFFYGYFKNSKNHPPQPRIIAMYSNDWGLLTEYMHGLFDEYVQKYKGTMLLGFISSFTERPEDNHIGVKYLSVGEEIKVYVRKFFRGSLERL